MNIICKVVGHKTVSAVATGNQYNYTDRLTNQTCIGNYMKMTRSKYCLRCGVLVHKDMTSVREEI